MDIQKFNSAVESITDVILAWAERLSGLVQENKEELLAEARGGNEVYEFWSAADKIRELMMVSSLFDTAAQLGNRRNLKQQPHGQYQQLEPNEPNEPQGQPTAPVIVVGPGMPQPVAPPLIDREDTIFRFYNLVAQGQLDDAAKLLAEYFGLSEERSQHSTLIFAEVVGNQKVLPLLDIIAAPREHRIGEVVTALQLAFYLPMHEALAVQQRLMGYERPPDPSGSHQ